jgi:hypothetical protein
VPDDHWPTRLQVLIHEAQVIFTTCPPSPSPLLYTPQLCPGAERRTWEEAAQQELRRMATSLAITLGHSTNVFGWVLMP